MITDIKIEKRVMHFRTPFKIAYEEVTQSEVVIVSITDEFGNIGLGSAAPDPEVTGETTDIDFRALREKLTPDFFDKPINDIDYFHKKIQKELIGLPSAQNAAEEAVLNLFSVKTGISLSKYFGGLTDSFPIMITLGIKNTESTLKELQERLSQGFEIIKLKVGLDYEEDAYKVNKIADILPNNRKLVLDANQGYSFEYAKKFIKLIKNSDVTLFEQPIDANNIEGLKELHHSSRIPIIADEACVSYEDSEKLLAEDHVSGVNIKLMKCGGPINFAKIQKLAKSLNKIMMIGCMYESNISITTGAAVAMGLGVDYADLDSGYLDFDDDPAMGGAQVINGAITIPDAVRLKQQ